MRPEPVESDRVRLRPYRDGDADDLVAGCGDPLVRHFLPQLPHPYTLADARSWIAEESVAVRAAGGAAYAIADPGSDRLLGGVGIGNPLPGRGQAEIGYWVAPRARGRGVATAAVRTLAGLALAAPAEGAGPAVFRRLELLTRLENTPSQRVALAAGFRREGIRHGAQLDRDGRPHDLVVWYRLAGDPPGPTSRLLPDLPGGSVTDGVVRLRPLAATDVDFLYRLRTAPEVVATSVPPVAPTRAALERICAGAAASWLAGERAELVIADAVTNEAAGEISLYYQEPPTGQAMIGYAMLPPWRGRGFPTRAARLVARWAFDTAGIGRLIAGTLPQNRASQRVLEKAGFHREGYLRGRLPGAGPDAGRVDDVLFGLLPGDLPAD